jgi:tetratricopeptide (TPR) repeat protein
MIGKTISHYKITEKLGEGGMGEVYLADDTKLKRQVAIKFLPEPLTKDKEIVERFGREAEATAALNHPNIVTIYDVLEEDNQLCIVMEYVDGKSLREVINEYNLGLDKIIDVISQISEGLSKAHKAGIVHRDIKPENIIIDQDARVKILDFGLAKLKGVSKLTKETSTLGTIHYMSPEQIQGKELNQTSDIWSLGIVLYELLTGEPPFSGEYEQAVSYAILNESLKPVIDKDKPEELKRIIEKCLTKDPADRYQNAYEIKNDLSFLKGEYRFKPTLRIHSNKKRYFKIAIPILAALAAVVILLFVAPEAENTAPIPIAVVDFVNETGEDELSSLSGMLTTALEQSKRISVITRSHMFDILKKLEKENVDYINETLGREIANQAGIKVLVLASVQKFDQLYNIDLKVIDPIEDKYLFAASEKDRSKENIPEMIDRLAEKTREGLEESAEDIQQTATPVAEITTPNIEAYQHYFKGQEYIDKSMFTEAEKEFEKAIALDSTFGLAYYRLAYTINWENEPQRAKEPLSKAFVYIDKIPDKEKYLVRFVNTMLDSGWGNPALKILREMEKLYPNDKEMIYNIGDISYHNGEYTEAKKYLEKVLDIDPKSVRTIQHLRGTYEALGESGKMLMTPENFVSIAGFVDSYTMLNLAYSENYFEKAYEILKNTYKLNKTNGLFLNGIARFLFDRRLHDHAVAYLNKIEETSPDYWNSLPVANSYGFRGHIIMYDGYFIEAEKDFIRALAIEPGDVYSVNNYANLLLALKRYGEVRQLYTKLEKLYPDGNQYLEAALYAVKGNKERALNINLIRMPKARIYMLLQMKEESIQSLTEISSFVLKNKVTFYTGMTNWPTYDFLRDDPRFQEILLKHKEIYEENLRKYGDLIDLIKE